MTFRTSLSGLDAASTDLSVVGNNIANASTNGFKESRAEFVDVFATTFTGVSSNTPGSGVRVATVAQQFGQGNIEFTSSNLDLAISGEGFLLLMTVVRKHTHVLAHIRQIEKGSLWIALVANYRPSRQIIMVRLIRGHWHLFN